MEIHTERLRLREYRLEDWEDIHVYGSNAEILVYEAWGPNSEAESKAFIERAIQWRKETPRMTFEMALTLKGSDKVIGGCGFRIHRDNPKRGDFGYIVHPDFWKQGIATEASAALINHIIQNENVSEIEAKCDINNIASQKVLEKNGLTCYKEVKKEIEMKGRWRDSFFYERIIA